MRRILGLGLILASLSLLPLAAKNSHEFWLPSDVRVGSTQLPQGPCTVTWTETSGSQVQLTLRTQWKTATIPAQIVEGKNGDAGLAISDVNGVKYLVGLHTNKVKFIIQEAPNGTK